MRSKGSLCAHSRKAQVPMAVAGSIGRTSVPRRRTQLSNSPMLVALFQYKNRPAAALIQSPKWKPYSRAVGSGLLQVSSAHVTEACHLHPLPTGRRACRATISIAVSSEIRKGLSVERSVELIKVRDLECSAREAELTFGFIAINAYNDRNGHSGAGNDCIFAACDSFENLRKVRQTNCRLTTKIQLLLPSSSKSRSLSACLDLWQEIVLPPPAMARRSHSSDSTC